MRGFRPSLTFSILASLACLLTLTWILFSLFAFKSAERDLYAQKGEHARMLLATFVNQLPEKIPAFPEGMLYLDSSAAIYAGKLAEERTVERLTLLDAGGKVIFTAGRAGNDIFSPFVISPGQSGDLNIMPGGTSLARIALVTRNGQQTGRAGLLLSLTDEQARIQKSRQLFLSYFAIDFILLLGLGSYILSRIVVRPVNRLLAATERITGGVYGHRIAVSGPMELAKLADSFNTMSDTLQQKQAEVRLHVDALEEANKNLKQAREEAVRSEKMASVGLLAAGTAHEIGTPLASVMGYAEILASELESDQHHLDYLKRILDGCGRIDRIVRGLLEYARPKPPSFEQVDIVALLADTVELLQHQGLLKKCIIETACEASIPLVSLDPYQLQQVLINLIMNGADAMEEGGVMKLSAVYSNEQEHVRIDINDSGSGILPENISRIFDPFFTTKEPGRGTGLGLAIAARIIDSFGGRIKVQSFPDEGSCFSLILPLPDRGSEGLQK